VLITTSPSQFGSLISIFIVLDMRWEISDMRKPVCGRSKSLL
jgi:hypothetical protein